LAAKAFRGYWQTGAALGEIHRPETRTLDLLLRIAAEKAGKKGLSRITPVVR